MVTRSCPSNTRVGVTASFTATAFTGYEFRKTKLFGTHDCIEGDGKVLDLLDFRTGRRECIPIPTGDVPKGLEVTVAATRDSSTPSCMPWSPVIRPLTFRIRVKRWLRTTSPGPPNKLGSPPRSSTLLAPIVAENGSPPWPKRSAARARNPPPRQGRDLRGFGWSEGVLCGHLRSRCGGVAGRVGH
jgi:hypothetical protein